MSQITTHVLDAGLGIPAVDIDIVLERRSETGWVAVASGTTDSDGRIGDLGPTSLDDGDYRLVFETGPYFTRSGRDAFYPEITVAFRVTSSDHYHVPILLSPFAYSTYRGS